MRSRIEEGGFPEYGTFMLVLEAQAGKQSPDVLDTGYIDW